MSIHTITSVSEDIVSFAESLDSGKMDFDAHQELLRALLSVHETIKAEYIDQHEKGRLRAAQEAHRLQKWAESMNL